MRRFWLTMALIGLLALPVLAQRGGFGFFGGGQMSGDMLLTNKSVQKELKFDDSQKKALAEITKKTVEAFTEAGEARKDGDNEKAKEIMTKANEERTKSLKKFKESLSSEQSKRFREIEVQVATKNHDINIFNHPGVQKNLKLTPKQLEAVKEAKADFEKDQKEVFEDAKGDKSKFKGLMQKIQDLRKDAYEKVTKTLTDEQAKTLKDMGGEKFDLVIEKGGRFGGGKGKGNKKKQDDFPN